MVSDRRLTTTHGPHNDEFNKALVLVCRDAVLVSAFSGLAQAPGFHIGKWLAETLPEAVKPDCLAPHTMERLARMASKEITALQVSPAQKRLSMIFAGFHFGEQGPRPYVWTITNCENDQLEPLENVATEFKNLCMGERLDNDEVPTFISASGSGERLVSESDMDKIKALLDAQRPPKAIVGKFVSMIRQIAEAPETSGTVGRQCMSVVLHAKDGSTESEYHTETAKVRAFAPNKVVALAPEGPIYSVMGAEFGSRDSEGRDVPVAGPKIGRNDPCWCGSGKKFKKCHGGPPTARASF